MYLNKILMILVFMVLGLIPFSPDARAEEATETQHRVHQQSSRHRSTAKCWWFGGTVRPVESGPQEQQACCFSFTVEGTLHRVCCLLLIEVHI